MEPEKTAIARQQRCKHATISDPLLRTDACKDEGIVGSGVLYAVRAEAEAI
jgi:hypothetical protein